jgi:hypothetical protein
MGVYYNGEMKRAIINALTKNPEISNAEIAREVGATKSYVSRVRIDSGFESRQERVADQSVKMRVIRFTDSEMEKPVEDRKNIKQIAEEIGCSYRYCAEIIEDMCPNFQSLSTMQIRKINARKTFPVGVYVDEEMFSLLEEEAKTKNIKFSTVIRRMIEESLKEKFGYEGELHTCKQEVFQPNKRIYRNKRRRFPILLYTRLIEDEIVLLDEMSYYQRGKRKVHNRQKTIRNLIRARYGLPIDLSQKGREHHGDKNFGRKHRERNRENAEKAA